MKRTRPDSGPVCQSDTLPFVSTARYIMLDVKNISEVSQGYVANTSKHGTQTWQFLQRIVCKVQALDPDIQFFVKIVKKNCNCKI